MEQLKFTVPELLSLIGVAQCVYLITYMSFRAGNFARAALPLAYFAVLALAFASDFGARVLGPHMSYYYHFQWAAWFMGPPLSVPLIAQIARIERVPPPGYFLPPLFIPAAYLFSGWAAAASGGQECASIASACEGMRKWLTVFGAAAGCFSLLAIWVTREDIVVFSADKKTGKDRYWLIIALILANVAFLCVMLLDLGAAGGPAAVIRTVLGLVFVYLTGTSLFRIYPQALLLSASSSKEEGLTPQEREIALKVEALLERDKVYHERDYSRADLARECQASEAVISRIINLHFKKSFPRVINEYRVGDARRLLEQTEASVKVIAEEVGFSSLASFNRAFREIAGETPTAYRQKAKIRA